MTLYRINDTSTGGERVLTVDEIIALELMLGVGALVPVEPDDVMNAAHKLVHPMYDNAADCDKFWCEPFRALEAGVGEETP